MKHNSHSIVYLSHGGGPMPLLNEPSHLKMIDFMKALPSRIEEPEEILVISAHWEENVPTVISGKTPPLLYDYYGFPEETYNLSYGITGHPSLARDITDILDKADIKSASTSQRGFDHGVFIPLMMMFPQGGVPVTQLSLVNSLDPREHLELGKALRPLLDRNILIIGSGFSFHNMGAFRWDTTREADSSNDAFQDWLVDTCVDSYSPEESEKRLNDWSKSGPHARYCHPREEHLLPLHICSALAGAKAELCFDDYILGKRATAFLWQ